MYVCGTLIRGRGWGERTFQSSIIILCNITWVLSDTINIEQSGVGEGGGGEREKIYKSSTE